MIFSRSTFILIGFILSLALTSVYLHARQVWPVQNQDVVGAYRNARNSRDVIYLKSNGDYEHNTGKQKYIGKWSINNWDGDVSILTIQFQKQSDQNTSYIVGSRFGQVKNLYMTSKSFEEWRKFAK